MTTPNIPLEKIPALDRKFRLQFEEAQDSWVLLYPEGMVKLNPSAAEILKRCDGNNDINAIISDLEASFETDQLGDEINAFLEIALEQQWILLN